MNLLLCTCTRCKARVAANAVKAERILQEVGRYVCVWAGVEVVLDAVELEVRYTNLLLSVEYVATDAIFQCSLDGPVVRFDLGKTADRDLVAWIHEQIVNTVVGALVPGET